MRRMKTRREGEKGVSHHPSQFWGLPIKIIKLNPSILSCLVHGLIFWQDKIKSVGREVQEASRFRDHDAVTTHIKCVTTTPLLNQEENALHRD